MSHLARCTAKPLGLVLAAGMMFSGLSCVTRAAQTVTSGLTLVGSTGAFGLLSPAVVQVGTGIDFVTDIIRLGR